MPVSPVQFLWSDTEVVRRDTGSWELTVPVSDAVTDRVLRHARTAIEENLMRVMGGGSTPSVHLIGGEGAQYLMVVTRQPPYTADPDSFREVVEYTLANSAVHIEAVERQEEEKLTPWLARIHEDGS